MHAPMVIATFGRAASDSAGTEFMKKIEKSIPSQTRYRIPASQTGKGAVRIDRSGASHGVR